MFEVGGRRRKERGKIFLNFNEHKSQQRHVNHGECKSRLCHPHFSVNAAMRRWFSQWDFEAATAARTTFAS